VNGSKELLELLKKEFGNEATEVKEFYDLCHEKYPLSSYFSPPVSLAEIMDELNRGMEGREAPKQEEKKEAEQKSTTSNDDPSSQDTTPPETVATTTEGQ